MDRAPKRSWPARCALLGCTVAVAAVTLTGCTTNRQIEFAPSTTQPTTTVTVTVTVTPSLTLPTSSTTTTGTAPIPPPLPGPTSATTSAGPFNRALAEQTYASIVTDIAVLDGQFATGASPALRLDVLSKQFSTLFTIGVPPGLDGPSYLSRVRTLEMFAAAAAQEALTDPPRAAERYQVVRRETALLLSQVNAVLGSRYTLPAATPSPTSSLTAPPR